MDDLLGIISVSLADKRSNNDKKPLLRGLRCPIPSVPTGNKNGNESRNTTMASWHENDINIMTGMGMSPMTEDMGMNLL